MDVSPRPLQLASRPVLRLVGSVEEFYLEESHKNSLIFILVFIPYLVSFQVFGGLLFLLFGAHALYTGPE